MATVGPNYVKQKLPASFEKDSAVSVAAADSWRAMVQKLAQETVEAATSTAFVPKDVTNGVEVCWFQEPDNPLTVIRGRVTIPDCTPEDMMAFQAGGDTTDYVEFMSTCDEIFLDGRTLLALEGAPPVLDAAGNATNEPQLPWVSVRWAVFQTPFPLWYRDFVFIEADLRLNDEWFVSCSSSVADDSFSSLEESHKFVRGRVCRTGYVWRALTPTSIELIYVVQVDAAGFVPVWIQNVIAPEQAQNCARIRDIMVGKRAALTALGAAPHPSLEKATIKVMKVKARSDRRVKLRLLHTGTVTLRWQFCVPEKNIGCYLEYDTKQDVGEWQMGNEARYAQAPTTGTLTITCPVNLTIVMDNSFSKMTDKVVYFRCSVVHAESGAPVINDPLLDLKLSAGYHGRFVPVAGSAVAEAAGETKPVE